MRKDGTFIFYMIQHRVERPKLKKKHYCTCNDPHCLMDHDRDTWVFSSLDHFGCPKGFNASGQCWQETGVLGVYSKQEALRGLAWIARRNPGTTFRLVRRITFQLTEPVNGPA